MVERETGTDATGSDRRTFLAATGSAGVALLAGCTEDLSAADIVGGTEEDPDPTTPEGEHEADVVGLVLQGSGADLAFEVTVENRSETGHVDWWQVERADGTVGTDDPIVRHETEVPDRATATEEVGELDDGSVVVVRAHHSEGGYGGKAIVGKPAEGQLAMARQGREPAPQDDHSFDSGGFFDSWF